MDLVEYIYELCNHLLVHSVHNLRFMHGALKRTIEIAKQHHHKGLRGSELCLFHVAKAGILTLAAKVALASRYI